MPPKVRFLSRMSNSRVDFSLTQKLYSVAVQSIYPAETHIKLSVYQLTFAAKHTPLKCGA
jgi:hypothetical protein